MRLAQLVIGVSGWVCFIAACGGEVPDSGAADGDAAVFYPDVAADVRIPPAPGWKSFTVTFSAETSSFRAGAPSSPVPVLMAGKTMRLDFDNGAFRPTHLAGAVFVDSFAEPVGFGGSAGTPLLMQADRERGTALLVHDVRDGHTVDLRFDSLLFDLDAHALPRGGVVKGSIYVDEDRASHYGEVLAAFVAVPDLDGPRWRGSAATTFAPMALPWDARTLETSEPYEDHVTSAGLFPAIATQASPVVTTTLWGAPPRERERGLVLLLRSWDDAATLRTAPTIVHDFAGNASSSDALLTFPGLAVRRLERPALDSSTVALAEVATWGSVRSEDCPDATPAGSCIVLGPVDVSFCAPSSLAGLATRLSGNGATTFLVRAVAVPKGAIAGAPTNAVYFSAATPGQQARIDGSTLRWPPRGADGRFDTGWTTVTLPSLGEGAETGVGISLGGLGAPRDGSSCTSPYVASITLYLQGVRLTP